MRNWTSALLRLQVHAAVAAALVMTSQSALAWGFEGHEIIADIARAELSPDVRAKVDAILAGDPDTLTAPDMAARATWADAWRGAGHRETAQWHFVDQELDAPDLKSACFGFPAADQPASAGPSQDCVIDKVREFASELGNPAIDPGERLLALKYLLHFVGDLHQPLHASDNHDRGGNCVQVTPDTGIGLNLHAYWDTNVVVSLGRDPAMVASSLGASITPALRVQWQQGDAATWAQESFEIARASVYTIGSASGCPTSPTPIQLPTRYASNASGIAAVQLEKAGVRLGLLLNQALGGIPVASSSAVVTTSVPPASGTASLSVRCSAEATAKGLHGSARTKFRLACLRRA